MKFSSRPENLGKRLSIDETFLSNGKIYTILTNKAAKGKKGTIVAMVAGTKADTVIAIIEKIPLKARNQVTEITLDMTANMVLIYQEMFSKCYTGNRPIPCTKARLRSITENQNQIPLASNRLGK